MVTSDADRQLLESLGAETGIVSAIGAGGKKTTLYRLFRAHPGPAALTATAFTTTFPAELDAETIIGSEEELLHRVPAASSARIAYAQPSDKPGRLAGLDGGLIGRIHQQGGFRLTLVKADGARMRRIKCPEAHEPDLPPETDTVLLILSALAIGRPLTDKIAHRPERIAAVTGRALGEPVTPADLAAIYSQDDGLLKGTGGCKVIPVLNMVDDATLEQAAREVARRALDSCPRFDRFVLTSNRRPDYIVDVLTR